MPVNSEHFHPKLFGQIKNAALVALYCYCLVVYVYRRAAGVLGKVVGFVSDQKTAIVNKLKDRSNGWGSPSLWTRAQISNAGNLLSKCNILLSHGPEFDCVAACKKVVLPVMISRH